MPRKKAEYSIHELSKRANVSVRTVRFYIKEGLLSPPRTRGRYTVYNDEYLDRLELIRRLKDSFLPLKEIRAILTSLSWDEVRASLADLRRREGEQEAAWKVAQEVALPENIHFQREHRLLEMREEDREEDRSSALEYISDLLKSTPVNRPLPPRSVVNASRTFLPSEPNIQPESWQRVPLGSGLELHIRQPLRPEDQKKVAEIIQLAKKLFSSET